MQLALGSGRRRPCSLVATFIADGSELGRAMAVALDELMVSVGSEGADSEEVSLQEQLRLAGELGNALLSDNDRLQREAEELKDIIAELEHVRIYSIIVIPRLPVRV